MAKNHNIVTILQLKINKFNVDKIVIYPYGGLVKMNTPINTKINKELSVAVSGLIFQTITKKKVANSWYMSYI